MPNPYKGIPGWDDLPDEAKLALRDLKSASSPASRLQTTTARPLPANTD